MIDGGIFLGRNPTNGNVLSEDAVISTLDKYSIQKALVASYKCIFFDYKEGNEDLIRFYKRYPERIIPVAIVQPTGFDSLKDKGYLSYLHKSGMRALGIYLAPKYYNIQLESFLLRNIAKQAVEEGFVLQFGLQSVSDLYKVIDYYGDLKAPILIRWMSGRAYHSIAEILNVAKRHDHFYFDVGSLTCSGGIEHLIHSVGAKRLYFTSNIPESFELSSHMLLQSSRLQENDLNEIYSGTLDEVFFLSKKKSKRFNLPDWSRYFESIRERPKIDSHWHTDGWNIIEPEKEFSQFEKRFSQYSYKKVVLSSIRALNYDLAMGNEEMFKLIAKDARLYGLVVVDPTRIDETFQQMDRYSNHPKCVGIKTIQDLYGFGLDHSFYRPILEKAEEKNLPVMAHIPGMLEAAQKFPKLTFVCAHSTFERVKHMFKCPNVYFDLATSHNDVSETKLERFIAEAGEDKIIFASDGPLVDPSWTLGKLASSNIRPAQLDKILFSNALRAFPRLCSEEENQANLQ